MQIKLGEKIKELRKRDGRKQEDLANALGVTAQAVSRWESGGGYPDMNMIPAIANYFHVTIDALFGYHNDRDTKLQDYIKKAHCYLIENAGDLTACIHFIKKCLEEFPSEPELQICLAHALLSKGIEEVEKPNIYLEEAVALYEKLTGQNDRIITSLLDAYSLLGEYGKAEKKALEQPTIEMCREVLLAPIFHDQKGERYRGEAILALLHQLNRTIEQAIAKNEKLANSQEGIEISLAVRNLYEKIFGKECYGKFHSDLCMLDLRCVKIAANRKDYDQALTYYDSAFFHYTKFSELHQGDRFADDHFDTPLLSAVGNTSIPIIMCKAKYLEQPLSDFPEEIKTQIKNNPKYSNLFVK